MPGPALSWIRPRALRPGDVVGVCAPAGPVDGDRLERGVARLESLGYSVRVAGGARARSGFTAGSVEDRVKDLEGLVEDDAVAAIVAARGGAGAGRLLARLNPELWRAHPKALVGYSDVTALHLFVQRLGLASFHGPMVARELADGRFDPGSFDAALRGAGRYASPPDDLLAVRPGAAEGRLLGGCLSLLSSAAGTPWALAPADDTVLFVEDVDEPPYRIDRMLLQLRDSGALDRVRGVVFGDMRGCSPGREADYGLEDVIRDALADVPGPVALGLSSGHTASPLVTLPLGVWVRLESGPDGARLTVLEDAVAR